MIRRASKDSLVEIEPMLYELDLLHIENLPDRFNTRTKGDRVKNLENILYGGGVILHQSNDGFIAIKNSKNNKFWVEYLYVKKGARRKGLASALLRAAENELQNSELFVSVYCFNKEAIDFYKNIFQCSSIVYRKVII